MNTEELKEYWAEAGFLEFKEIPGVGLCGIQKFMFTFGIISGLNEWSYEGRWCYATLEEAQIALKHWDGTKDPLGMWIKYKGTGGEYSNKYHPGFKEGLDVASPHV